MCILCCRFLCDDLLCLILLFVTDRLLQAAADLRRAAQASPDGGGVAPGMIEEAQAKAEAAAGALKVGRIGQVRREGRKRGGKRGRW